MQYYLGVSSFLFTPTPILMIMAGKSSASLAQMFDGNNQGSRCFVNPSFCRLAGVARTIREVTAVCESASVKAVGRGYKAVLKTVDKSIRAQLNQQV